MLTTSAKYRALPVAGVSLIFLAATSATAAAGPLQGTSAIAGPLPTSVVANVVPGSYGTSIVGDVNGDGIADIATSRSDHSYIDLGRRPQSNLDLSSFDQLGARGFTITPSAASIQAAYPVAYVGKAGDVDGDGIADLLVVADRPYVVFGSRTNENVTLVPGPRVMAIDTGTHDAGQRATPIADFDGDGKADFAVSRNNNQGAAIIHGGARATTINANTAGARVTLINAASSCVFDWRSFKVTCTNGPSMPQPMGDFDGDGLADVAISTSIVYGRVSPAAINVSSLSPTTVFRYPALLKSSGVPVPVGDLNGDGKTDLIVPRNAPPTYPESLAVLFGRSGRPATIDVSEPTTTLSRTGSGLPGIATFTGIGDQNGDGRGDLALGLSRGTVKVLTGIPNSGNVNIDAAPTVPGIAGTAYLGAGSGDLDGDGIDDLVAQSDTTANHGTGPGLGGRREAVLVTHGPDQLGPDLVPLTGTPSTDSGLAPTTFATGASKGTTISVALVDAATVTLTYRRSDSTVAGTDIRSLPAGRTSFAWDGFTGGAALPAGKYTLVITPKDSLGNAGDPQSFPFTIDPAGGPASLEATLKVSSTILDPAGLLAGVTGEQIYGTCANGFETGTLPKAGGSELAKLNDNPPYPAPQEGQSCQLGANLDPSLPGIGYLGSPPCVWTDAVSINGAAARTDLPAPWTFTMRAGLNTFDLVRTCNPPQGVGPFSAAWKAFGDATVNSAAYLTPIAAGKTGSVVWPTPFNPNGKTYSFTAFFGGGGGGGEGLTLAFLQNAGGVPKGGWIGAGGNTIGFGGLIGTAIAFDTLQGPGEPGSNFLGVSNGTSGTSMNYVQTAPAPVRLRNTTSVAVKVVSKGGVVQVFVNGKLGLTRTMVLPTDAFLAFTGANTAGAQNNFVSLISVTDS